MKPNTYKVTYQITHKSNELHNERGVRFEQNFTNIVDALEFTRDLGNWNLYTVEYSPINTEYPTLISSSAELIPFIYD